MFSFVKKLLEKYIPVLLGFVYHGYMHTRGLLFGGEIVAVQLIAVKDGKVLLIRPTYRPHWEFPGGAVDPGERIEDAARREAYEEALIVVEGELQQVTVVTKIEYHMNVSIHLFLAQKWNTTGTWKPGLEIRNRSFFPVQELPEKTSVLVKDALSLLAQHSNNDEVSS